MTHPPTQPQDALDHAFVRMPDGTIRRQMEGIPMGDPLSPGMTIGTCAWMEDEWMQTIADSDKQYFRIKRFMDDILMVYAENEHWDADRQIHKGFPKFDVLSETAEARGRQGRSIL